MNSKVIFLFAILFLELLLSSQLNLYAAPLDDWQKLIQSGSAQKFDGQYANALQIFTKALTIAENQNLPSKYLPITLCRVADVEVIINKIDQADEHFKKIIQIIKQQKEENTLDPQVSFWAAVLSDSYMSNTKPETREKCLKRACYLKGLIYDASHRECLECLNKLAACYIDNGDVNKAVHILTLTQSVVDKKYGKDPNRLSNVFNQLAIKCRTECKYNQAKQLELAAIKLATENTSKSYNSLPAFYFLLSMTSLAQQKEIESTAYLQKAIQSCAKIKSNERKATEQYFDPLVKAIWEDHKRNPKSCLAGNEFEQLLTIYKAIPTDLNSQYLIYTYLAEVSASEPKHPQSTSDYVKKAIAIAETRKNSLGKYLPDLYMRTAIGEGAKKNIDAMNKTFTKAINVEQDKTGFHATLALLWWGYYLQANKKYQLALEKLNMALKQASLLPSEQRGTLLADSTELTSNIILYQLQNDHLAEILHQQSLEEVKLQKQLHSKIGPDLFHRL